MILGGARPESHPPPLCWPKKNNPSVWTTR
jgi:hypothetical protein